MIRRIVKNPCLRNFNPYLKCSRTTSKGSNILIKPSHSHVRALFSAFLKPQQDFGTCDILTCAGKISPERSVPDHILKPDYYYELNDLSSHDGPGEIKTPEQISGMRRACALAATILSSAGKLLQIGLTTDEIDEFVHNEAIRNNAYPSPLRYMGYPKSVCTSVNNVACHGIPDDRPLKDGDIINIDVTVFFEGYHGDCSKTFLVGNVDERGRYLVECTEACLNKAISICGPNVPMNLIGKTISKFAQEKGLNVLPHFIGHGIGSYFHGPPEVLPYANAEGGLMEEGQTFTIEPILTLGGMEVNLWEDMWTAVSADGARSAQFEHTILITENGCDILTLPDK